MNKYDHSQLKAGDPAAYGSLSGGWGYGYVQIHHTTVDRLTATQIVMKNGTRFRRENGRKVGSDWQGTRLLDPKGSEVREAILAQEVQGFGPALDQWDKQRRQVRTLDGWAICLSQLEALIASARRRITEIEEGFE